MKYFGTDTRSLGHYIWDVGKESLYNSSIDIEQLPFNPESLPNTKGLKKGSTTVHYVDGWSILRVEGSPVDSRGGCKSVFIFQEDHLPPAAMLLRVIQHPVTRKIIDAMPFELIYQVQTKT